MILTQCSYSRSAVERTSSQEDLDDEMKELDGLCEGFSAAKQRLERLKNTYSYEGWDGGNAAAVNSASYDNARKFLAEVPLGIDAPDPGVDVNGQMTLEWRRNDGRLLSLTFDGFGNVHCIVFVRSAELYMKIPATKGYNGKMRFFLEDVMGSN